MEFFTSDWELVLCEEATAGKIEFDVVDSATRVSKLQGMEAEQLAGKSDSFVIMAIATHASRSQGVGTEQLAEV
jgi:hypothetical protein